MTALPGVFAASPPDVRHIVVSYGGGVNTIALLVWLRRAGIVPTAIVMADPGSEWPETERYRDTIAAEWLARARFPAVEVIRRAELGVDRPRAWRLESLREECMRTESLPSIAYGWKKCSQKFKAEPQRWWIVRQPWALEEWAAGRKIGKVIGYDADEGVRVARSRDAGFGNAWEAARFVAWSPLFEAGLTRDDCERLILDEGLPIPPKSACTFCPHNTLEEWTRLRATEPGKFTEAVEMSHNAKVDAPDVVGLMRCNPHGRRQLHVWADGGYDDVSERREQDTEVPCECAL